MSNKSFKDGVQFAWDGTSLEAAQTCPKKYYYMMILGLRPRHKSVHLIFGGHYATALEHFYKYRAEGLSIDDALLKVVRETLIATWDDEAGAPQDWDEGSKTRFTLIRSIIWYVDQFGEESPQGIQTMHLANGKPAVELSFSFEFRPDILYCGHLDRAVTYANANYIMDQKTTGGVLSTAFFRGFDLSNQMSGYALAGQIVLNSPVKGVIIDGAQIAVGFTKFERGFTYRTKDQLDEWAHNAELTIRGIQFMTEMDRFTMNYTACGNYGGCPYRKLCSATPHIRPAIMESEYDRQVWDPIERR